MRALLVLSLLVAGLIAAACGSQGTTTASPETVIGSVPQETGAQTQIQVPQGDPAAGKQIFASAGCGSCHTLADAGTTGTVGPNLDEAKPSLELAYDRVTNGQGGMPSFKDRLTEQQRADVAAYVVQATSG
jgi:mono/diheme cytochrome c family protein